MMEAIRSTETLALTGATRRNIPEDAIPYGIELNSLSTRPELALYAIAFCNNFY
jgi:hypothetical protein